MSSVARVSVGSKSHVRFPDGKIRVIQVVDTPQAVVPEKGIVSHESPLGQSLIGKKAGERARYSVGVSWIHIEVIAIER